MHIEHRWFLKPHIILLCINFIAAITIVAAGIKSETRISEYCEVASVGLIILVYLFPKFRQNVSILYLLNIGVFVVYFFFLFHNHENILMSFLNKKQNNDKPNIITGNGKKNDSIKQQTFYIKNMDYNISFIKSFERTTGLFYNSQNPNHIIDFTYDQSKLKQIDIDRYVYLKGGKVKVEIDDIECFSINNPEIMPTNSYSGRSLNEVKQEIKESIKEIIKQNRDTIFSKIKKCIN